MSKHLFHILLAVAILVCASSCHLRPLEDASETVQIRVDVNVRVVTNVTVHTRYSTNPRIDQLTKEKEEQLNSDIMRVLVYNPSTKNLVNQAFVTSKTTSENGDQMFSGYLNISYGTFDFLVYNFDTPTTHVKDENNENTILAYTNPVPESLLNSMASSKAGNFDGIDINYEPEHLLVARHPEIRVSPHDTIIVIKTEAQSIIDTYYIQIHVEGMQYASSKANAVITGLSPSNSIGLGQRTLYPPCGITFDLRQSTDESLSSENKDVLCAVFNTFGKIDDVSSDLRVTFNVIDAAGNLQQKEVNLDTIFKSKEAIENHWLLIDETWVIEKPSGPQTQDGGFQPWVNDWDVTEGNISL